jgi:hypothetical protein
LERPDLHCHHITRVRLSLKERVLEWVGDGSMSTINAQDVLYQLDYADLKGLAPASVRHQ